VDAAETVEQWFVERLHSHRDAVYTEVAEQFLPCQAKTVAGLHSTVNSSAPVKFNRSIAERICSHWRRLSSDGVPPAKENRAWLKIVRHKFQLADERGDVAVDEVAAGRLGIKGAVRAFLRAEWDVNIKAFDRSRDGNPP